MRLAVGIPFFASKNIEPLLLCIESLKRYTSFEYDLFLLLNCSDKEQYKEFCYPEILSVADEVYTKYYFGDDNAYKQTLIDWITDSKNVYEYMFILHGDVFLYKEGVLETMLRRIIDTDKLISCWEVPTTLFSSTFHLSYENKLEFVVSPRPTTWIMCLNVSKYRDFRDECVVGRYLFMGFEKREKKPDISYIWDWFYDICPKELRCHIDEEKAIIDHGGVLMYYLRKGVVFGEILGEDINPSLDSLDLYYHPGGFVHIGQSDPNRYNDEFYSKELLRVRMESVRYILKEQYLIK